MAYTNSGLVTYTKLSPHRNAPRNQPIRKITIHHTAGVTTIESLGALFAHPERKGSSNYGIGNDGRIGLFVDESNRAWTSSSADNDHQAITIEVSNSATGGDWPVSAKAYAALIDLCVDICKRNNIKLIYDGTTKGTLTRHNMFAATACPGKYLQDRFPAIADEVNKRLSGASKDTITKDNLSKLVSAKVITTPDYWTSLSLQYLNELCSNAVSWVDARVSNGIKDFSTALKVLSEAGIINSPAYWETQAKKVKYIDELIINIANRSLSILEKIVMSEAGGEDEKGQILVANVIMNRVKNKSFPNSVYDVIVQTNQFEPVRRGTFAKAVPTAKVKASVDKALSGTDYSKGALYFRAIKGATADCWHETALTRLFDHGGHRFYM